MAPDDETTTTATEETSATPEAPVGDVAGEESTPVAAVLPATGKVEGELRLTKSTDGATVLVEIVDSIGHSDSIEVSSAQLEGAVTAGSPANAGEDLGTTSTNPTATPDAPGVEPGQGVDDDPDQPPASEPATEGAPNAPATTDPGGDTAKQNAPDAPAPEPGGANVSTNPGTESSSTSQTEAPESPPATGTPEVKPAAEASEKPLYTSGFGEVPTGYVDSGLVTPDGQTLYHFAGDVAGEPHKGDLPVYADDAPTVATAQSSE